MLGGEIVSSPAKFSLEAYTAGIEWTGVDRIPRNSTLSVRVVMVIAEVSRPVIKLPAIRVHEPRWVELVYDICESELWIVICDLAPAFVVDYPCKD